MELMVILIIAYSFLYLMFFNSEKSLYYSAYYLLVGICMFFIESGFNDLSIYFYLTVCLLLYHMIYRKKQND